MTLGDDGASSSDSDGVSPDPIDQVRELLFGAPKRDTIDQIRVLEARIGALESRLSDLARDGEERRAALEAVGGALTRIGATIQNMSERRKGE